MNAIDARKLSQYVTDTKLSKELSKARQGIEETAKGGQFEYFIYDSISDNLRSYLEGEGYKVGLPLPAGPNEIMIKISW